nr:hypothetical protein [Tanacetum cinerariifolium]
TSDAVGSQPQSSHVVHAGPNLEPLDLEATDASPLQNPKQLDEEFTTTAYPNVQENLKLPSEDSVIPEEPTSSTRTLSSLQALIHQDTSSVPLMTTPVIDLMMSHSSSPLPTSSVTTLTVMTTTIPPPPPQPQQSTTDPTLMKRIDKLKQHMANLLQYNLA